MSDPASVLRPALATWLRNDTAVRAAFGAKTVKVFEKLPPANEPSPYLFIAGFFVNADEAECLDATQVDVQIDIWSLTNPPAYSEAETFGAAIKASIARMEEDVGNSPEFSISGFTVRAVQATSTQYVTDIGDGKTVHGIVRATLSVDPT